MLFLHQRPLGRLLVVVSDQVQYSVSQQERDLVLVATPCRLRLSDRLRPRDDDLPYGPRNSAIGRQYEVVGFLRRCGKGQDVGGLVESPVAQVQLADRLIVRDDNLDGGVGGQLKRRERGVCDPCQPRD